eukprot:7185199-Prymnesium_polylepis.1
MMQACKAPPSDIWCDVGVLFNVHLQPHSKRHAGAQHEGNNRKGLEVSHKMHTACVLMRHTLPSQDELRAQCVE